MEVNIEITSSDSDNLESMINEIHNSKELDEEKKLDEERKLHGTPLLQERQILNN
jgi:hypothetical protein